MFKKSCMKENMLRAVATYQKIFEISSLLLIQHLLPLSFWNWVFRWRCKRHGHWRLCLWDILVITSKSGRGKKGATLISNHLKDEKKYYASYRTFKESIHSADWLTFSTWRGRIIFKESVRLLFYRTVLVFISNIYQ